LLQPNSSNMIRRIRRRKPAIAYLTAMAMVLGFAGSASALSISGGPFYAGSGGVNGSCSISGITCLGSGATVTCNGLTPSFYQNLYFGLRNDLFIDGIKMVGSAGPVPGTDQFTSGAGSSSIIYTGTTTVYD